MFGIDEKMLLLNLLEALPDYAAILDSCGKRVIQNSNWRSTRALSSVGIEFFTKEKGDIRDLSKFFLEKTAVKKLNAVLGGHESKVSFEICTPEIVLKSYFRLTLSSLGVSEELAFIAVFQEFTEEIELREALKSAIYKDDLTGVGNENALYLSLSKRLCSSSERTSPFLIALLELDNIREFLATFGKRITDTLLIKTRERLEDFFQDTELFKLNYATFVILLERLNRERLVHILDTLLDILERKIVFENLEFTPRINLGICQYPEDGLSEDALLSNCLTAVDLAKKEERKWNFYGLVNEAKR